MSTRGGGSDGSQFISNARRAPLRTRQLESTHTNTHKQYIFSFFIQNKENHLQRRYSSSRRPYAAMAPELLVPPPLVAREELEPLSQRLVRQLRGRD